MLFQRHRPNPWRQVSDFISVLQGQVYALLPFPVSGRREEWHGSSGSEARRQPAVERSPCGQAQGEQEEELPSQHRARAFAGPPLCLASGVPGKPRCPTRPGLGVLPKRPAVQVRTGEPRGGDLLVCATARRRLPGWVNASLPPFLGSWCL